MKVYLFGLIRELDTHVVVQFADVIDCVSVVEAGVLNGQITVSWSTVPVRYREYPKRKERRNRIFFYLHVSRAIANNIAEKHQQLTFLMHVSVVCSPKRFLRKTEEPSAVSLPESIKIVSG